MATRDDVSTDVATLVGTDPQLSTAERNVILQLRYEDVYEKLRWSQRLRDFTISLVAQTESTSSDTVTVTNASATVTSAGTPFTSAMTGRQIQIGALLQYLFVTFVSSSSITLHDGEGTAVTWPGATAAGQTWRIFQTIYALPSTADEVVSLHGEIPMEEYDGGRGALDERDPYRITTAADPTHWFYAGVNSSGAREVELWPVPTTAKLLRGQHARKAPTLAAATVIDMPRGLLLWATAADCLNMLHSKTGDASYQALGLFYERKANETWNDYAPREAAKLSPTMSLGRGPLTLGAGYYVTHHHPSEG